MALLHSLHHRTTLCSLLSAHADEHSAVCRLCSNSLLTVAHVNHQINTAEANAAQALVENYCQTHDIDCYVGTFNVPKLARESKRGLEETARTVRYDFFAALLEKLNADYYVTAHTHDDNAETVLQHILRGCGTHGLRGMQALQGKHLRPLLHVTRAQIDEYVAMHNIKCAVDSSNADIDYTRNRIRHQLLPLLREFNPQINNALNRLANIAAQDTECLNTLATALVHSDEQGQSYCLRHEILPAPCALQARALRKLYARQGLEQKHIAAMLEAIERHSGTELPHKLRLNVRKGKVTINENSNAILAQTVGNE